jgi:hypothetical protein
MIENRWGPLLFAVISAISYFSFAKGNQATFRLYDAFSFSTLYPILPTPDSVPTISLTMMISICFCVIVACRNVPPLFRRSCEDGKSSFVQLSYFTVNRSEQSSIPRVGQKIKSVLYIHHILTQAISPSVVFVH